MILDERLLTYINSLDAGNGALLDEIEKEALESEVPIVRKDMQNFLKLLLAIKRPKRMLEVGCAVGFSALLMAEYAPDDAQLTTIENWPPRIPVARENFKRAGRDAQITLLEGDAGEILPKLLEEGRSYDWIFMDAAKGQDAVVVPTVLGLLEKDGILISDNVLFDGEIIESRFAVTRRNRTIHKRMREYLYTLTHDEHLQTSVLPVGDGAAITVKR